MNRKSFVSGAVGLVGLTTLVSGCGTTATSASRSTTAAKSKTSAAGSPRYGGTIHLAYQNNVPFFDPARADDGESVQMTQLTIPILLLIRQTLKSLCQNWPLLGIGPMAIRPSFLIYERVLNSPTEILSLPKTSASH